MPNQKTRKAKRGGGPLNFIKGKLGLTSTTPVVGNNGLTNAQRQQLQIEKSKSHAMVSNYLKTPGEFKYTNKERIEKEFRSALDDIKKEDPKEVTSSLKTLYDGLVKAYQSETSKKIGVGAREVTAVTITLPVGGLQIMIKGLRLIIAFFVFWIAVVGNFLQLDIAIAKAVQAAAPNASFDTTSNFYKGARQFLGANSAREQVKNWKTV